MDFAKICTCRIISLVKHLIANTGKLQNYDETPIVSVGNGVCCRKAAPRIPHSKQTASPDEVCHVKQSINAGRLHSG